MAQYLDDDGMKEMCDFNDQLLAIREAAFLKRRIDLLDTDSSISLKIFQIVSQYDSTFLPNFARNGEDGKSDGFEDIESKNTKVEGHLVNGQFIHTGFNSKTGNFVKPKKPDLAILKREGKFQFHVMGDIVHDRYIFTVSRKDNMSILRLYDISDPANVKVINDKLQTARDDYLLKYGNVKKRDLVYITEKFLIDTFINNQQFVKSGCQIIKA